MNESKRFIKSYVKIMNWQWYQDVNTFKIFMHCLLRANYKDQYFKGMLIKRGSFVTTFKHLSEESGVGYQSTRTALAKLKSTHEITQKSTNKYTVITVVNYDKYQDNPMKSTNKLTHKLTNEQQTTNIDNRISRNNRKRESIEREPQTTPTPTLSEIISYGTEKGMTKKYCEKFYNYYQSNGWQKIKDWKARFNYWISQDKKAETTTDDLPWLE